MYFKLLIMKNLFSLCVIMMIATVVKSQIYFDQNFNSSTVLADYVGDPPSANQFDEIAISGTSTVEINAGKLRINRQLGSPEGRVGISRQTTFGGMSADGASFLKFSMKITISENDADVGDGFAFFFTKDANEGVSGPGATGRHSFIAIDPRATPGEFKIRANATSSGNLSGTKTIVSYINNSGASIDYTGANGLRNTIGNDKLDIWIIDESDAATLLLDEVAARDATGFLRDFKISCNASFTSTLDIDDIVLKEEAVLAPLPVSLTSFTAKNNEYSIALNWVTASEQNNSYFEISRSGDGKIFTSLGIVKGGGTTTEKQVYSYKDLYPLSGINYYRLTQVDFDGRQNLHHEIVSVKTATRPNEFKLNSLAEKQLNFSFYSNQDGTGSLSVSDLQGRILYVINVRIAKGFNTVFAKTPQNEGLYVANLTMNGEYYPIKFKK